MENKLSMKDLQAMTALQVPEDERVKSRFVNIYNTLQKSREGEYFYEKEKMNFLRVLSASQPLKEATAFSVYGCFIDIAAMGLSLDQTGQPMMYILPYNQKVGKNEQGQDQWEKRIMIEISPYGELALRMQCGQLQHADRPVVVFEGDKFQPMVNDAGQKIVRYEACIPRKSKKIIGSFIKLVRPNGSFDFFHMLEDDITRLAGYSAKKNTQSGANKLYSSNEGQIDTGFLEAKTLKHAFRTFPKLRLGQFSKLQTTEDEIQATDYGLEEGHVNEKQTEPDHFGPKEEEQTADTVQIEDRDGCF